MYKKVAQDEISRVIELVSFVEGSPEDPADESPAEETLNGESSLNTSNLSQESFEGS